MAQAFYGEVQLFAFNYAPMGWAFCNGQTMMVSQNTVVFSLLGNRFGGNGTSTFALPNLQGQAACATGSRDGDYPLGTTFGAETVRLGLDQTPGHTHTVSVYNQPTAANRSGSPSAGSALIEPGTFNLFSTTAAAGGTFPAQTLKPNVISGQSHSNQQPYLALNFCICLAGGIFPQRPG